MNKGEESSCFEDFLMVLYFKICDNTVYVLAVAHAKRLPGYWKYWNSDESQTYFGLTADMKFAICIHGCDVLESWKIYRILSDQKAEHAACVRVIDESGEDYLYPASRFLPVDLSDDIQAKLSESIEEINFETELSRQTEFC